MKKEEKKFDPRIPLSNERREMFCQYYSDECWGKPALAAQKAGYKPDSAQATGRTLLKRSDVSERISFLRELMLKGMTDKLWIAEQRREIIGSAQKESDRLSALKDLEKGLGLLEEDTKDKEAKSINVIFNMKDGTAEDGN